MEILKFFGIMAAAAIVWIGLSELDFPYTGGALAIIIVGLSFYFKFFDVKKIK